ncbi:unnamed protein product [Adineta ricciae]|uniref:Alkaline phosphatase, tissue-nonspecific isozyme n=1 Tax=Adineta ricciae TaxID=249248 RepID=A0A814QTT7_ADIRI|nr:unnamed protein product [Adineta ricciae]CAF1526443.1 unnamed protein product [Adineta ricciae]
MMRLIKLQILLNLILVSKYFVFAGRTDWSVEKNAGFWNEQARLSIEELLQRRDNTRLAKNVILFLGDGMGLSTVTAGRIRKGQIKGQLGEDFVTEMEQFQHLGLAKTYNIDAQTPDSAGTATAYLCGVKAQSGTIGVDGRTTRGDCRSSIGANVSSILDWAQQAGKKVGIITTTRVTHATPSAAYAHSANRDWETYDSKSFGANETKQGCVDIAYQLLSRKPAIDLIFGGGRRSFFPNTVNDVEYPNKKGYRTDNRSLIDEFWKGQYIWNRNQMKQVTLGSPTPLLGLFEYNHMLYETDRNKTNNDDPPLSELTKFAIEHFLAMSKDGFFLLIEGGKIDHGHHMTSARYALDEYVELDNAIGQAKHTLKEKGMLDDTLMVVTADHSHVFTFGGYSWRGSNILGFASSNSLNVSEIDHLPVTIINYGNGPNFPAPRNATYLSSLDTNSSAYLSPAAVPLEDETHGGEDVPVFAQGPWSHLFIGTMEQHTIAHKMAYAACWGVYKNRTGCLTSARTVTPVAKVTQRSKTNTASSSNSISFFSLIIFYFACLFHH